MDGQAQDETDDAMNNNQLRASERLLMLKPCRMLEAIALSQAFSSPVGGASHIDHAPRAAACCIAVSGIVSVRPHMMHVERVTQIMTGIAVLALVPAPLTKVDGLTLFAFIPAPPPSCVNAFTPK